MINVSKKTSLTIRQREIYEFLRDKIINRGYGPTVREIGLHFNIRSPNGVMCHLKALERKGLISREQNMSRAIQLSDSPQNRLSVSFTGTAAAGRALQPAASTDESVSFSPIFEGSDVCCLKIEGDGFLSLHIVDGDYLIVNREGVQDVGSLLAVMDDRQVVVLCHLHEVTRQLISAISGVPLAGTRQVIGPVAGVVRKFRVKTMPVEEPADEGVALGENVMA